MAAIRTADAADAASEAKEAEKEERQRVKESFQKYLDAQMKIKSCDDILKSMVILQIEA